MANANIAANNKADDAVSDLTQAELLKKLEAIERQLQEKDAELQQMKDAQASGLKVLAGAQPPYCGPNGGYKFRIAPKNPEKYPHLKPLTMNACDESEMIRYYCAVNEEVKGSNKRLDPVRCVLEVKCLDDNKRRDFLYKKQRVANIRMRLDQGQTVSDADAQLVDAEYVEMQQAKG